MIIEVDDNTKESKVYNSLYEFCAAHSDELAEKYRKQFAPSVEVNMWNLELIQSLLPSCATKIVMVTEHASYIVVKCEDGEVYSLNRIGQFPWFEIDLKPWSKVSDGVR